MYTNGDRYKGMEGVGRNDFTSFTYIESIMHDAFCRKIKGAKD
jgi:hypothetical protein